MSTFEPRQLGKVIPSYSLTGDLLNYVRCPYQYRLFTRTGVRESHPAQRWYGQFLHRGMRLAYENWHNEAIPTESYGWHSDEEEDGVFSLLVAQVVRTLRAEGLFRPGNMGNIPERRLLRCIRLLGQHLFPLIKRSEVRLSAIRSSSSETVGLYQVTGVVDVLAVAKFGEPGQNTLVDLILDRLDGEGIEVGTSGEIIVDYKGISRERLDTDAREAALNQVVTYGWLRNREADSDVVCAGVLCMVDDLLLPDGDDANVTPCGEEARRLLDESIEVVPVSGEIIGKGTRYFDTTVERIEKALAVESDSSLPEVWEPRPYRRTCVACDARWHCPASDIGENVDKARPFAPSAP